MKDRCCFNPCHRLVWQASCFLLCARVLRRLCKYFIKNAACQTDLFPRQSVRLSRECNRIRRGQRRGRLKSDRPCTCLYRNLFFFHVTQSMKLHSTTLTCPAPTPDQAPTETNFWLRRLSCRRKTLRKPVLDAAKEIVQQFCNFFANILNRHTFCIHCLCAYKPL